MAKSVNMQEERKLHTVLSTEKSTSALNIFVASSPKHWGENIRSKNIGQHNGRIITSKSHIGMSKIIVGKNFHEVNQPTDKNVRRLSRNYPSPSK